MLLGKLFVAVRAVAIKSLFVLSLFISFLSYAQQYDLLIKNGHVIDPKNSIDEIKDIAIANGKIAKVNIDIPSAQSKKTIDAAGFYVVPGLIDIHTHVFVGSKPDKFADGILQRIA